MQRAVRGLLWRSAYREQRFGLCGCVLLALNVGLDEACLDALALLVLLLVVAYVAEVDRDVEHALEDRAVLRIVEARVVVRAVQVVVAKTSRMYSG